MNERNMNPYRWTWSHGEAHTHTHARMQGTLFAICGPDGLRVRREPLDWAVFTWEFYPHPLSTAQLSLSLRRKVKTCFLRLPERVPPARITGLRSGAVRGIFPEPQSNQVPHLDVRPSGLQGAAQGPAEAEQGGVKWGAELQAASWRVPGPGSAAKRPLAPAVSFQGLPTS